MSSKRGYVTIDEVEEFADVTSSDDTEFEDQISMAEELIDSYVGSQDIFYRGSIDALASSATTTTLTLHSEHQNVYNEDFFKMCQIEIIGGTGSGQRRIIDSSTKAGVITVTESWTTTPDATSYYKIYQLGKFPRRCDVVFDSRNGADKYYKSIPEAIKRATAAQVEYIMQMGSEFFASNQSGKQSESIGDYSYTNAQGAIGSNQLIAPKVKLLLRGIKNIKGEIIV